MTWFNICSKMPNIFRRLSEFLCSATDTSPYKCVASCKTDASPKINYYLDGINICI